MSNRHTQLLQKDQAQLHPLHHPSRLKDNLMVERGEGVWLHTTDGRKVLDAMAGLWNVNIGYGNQELPEVAYKQMKDLGYTSGFAGMTNPPSAELADKLAGFAFPHLNFTYFTSGGSEATDTSIKTAWYYWRQVGRPTKRKIISLKYSYHGVTIGAMSATGNSKYHTMFGDLVPGFMHVPNPNVYRYTGEIEAGETVADAAARALEEMIVREGAETIAAFIIEPVQGAGGVIIPADGYHEKIMDICKKHDILVIADEVICGFGRTGKWFGSHHTALVPDILQFAKGVSSGYVQLGGMQVSDTIRDVIVNAPKEAMWMHGFTYAGHSVACAVASANIDIIERDGLIENSAKMGERLLAGLQGLVDEFPHIDNARGLGLIAGIDVVTSKETREADASMAAQISDAAIARDLRARPLGGTIAFSPSLAITADEVDTLIGRLGDAIAATA